VFRGPEKVRISQIRAHRRHIAAPGAREEQYAADETAGWRAARAS